VSIEGAAVAVVVAAARSAGSATIVVVAVKYRVSTRVGRREGEEGNALEAAAGLVVVSAARTAAPTSEAATGRRAAQ